MTFGVNCKLSSNVPLTKHRSSILVDFVLLNHCTAGLVINNDKHLVIFSLTILIHSAEVKVVVILGQHWFPICTVL